MMTDIKDTYCEATYVPGCNKKILVELVAGTEEGTGFCEICERMWAARPYICETSYITLAQRIYIVKLLN